MNINWIINYEKRLPISCAMFGDVNVLRSRIEESGELFVSVKNRTKTTLDIVLGNGNQVFGVAHVPSGCENLKFHYTSSHSYFHGFQELYYFKLTKKQLLQNFAKRNLNNFFKKTFEIW